MATAVNDITGDSISSGDASKAYVEGHARIYGERIKEECPVCGLSKVVGKECNHCLRDRKAKS